MHIMLTISLNLILIHTPPLVDLTRTYMAVAGTHFTCKSGLKAVWEGYLTAGTEVRVRCYEGVSCYVSQPVHHCIYIHPPKCSEFYA
jgi:hypothetical protein